MQKKGFAPIVLVLLVITVFIIAGTVLFLRKDGTLTIPKITNPNEKTVTDFLYTEQKGDLEEIYHIEQTQELCANDKSDADKIYSNYLITQNSMTLEPPASWKGTREAWVADRQQQGYIKEKLREKETEFYFEYPTFGGAFTYLMRLYKCSVFDPGGRTKSGIFIDDDTPETELGSYTKSNPSDDDMRKFIEYLAYKDGANCMARSRRISSTNSYFTYITDCEYFSSGDWGLPGKYIYYDSIYKLDKLTGLLTFERKITGTKEGPRTANPL